MYYSRVRCHQPNKQIKAVSKAISKERKKDESPLITLITSINQSRTTFMLTISESSPYFIFLNYSFEYPSFFSIYFLVYYCRDSLLHNEPSFFVFSSYHQIRSFNHASRRRKQSVRVNNNQWSNHDKRKRSHRWSTSKCHQKQCSSYSIASIFHSIAIRSTIKTGVKSIIIRKILRGIFPTYKQTSGLQSLQPFYSQQRATKTSGGESCDDW